MKIKGELRVPGDKSISHRAFMFGALAGGTTVIRSVLGSKDVQSTREAVQALGAKVEKKGDAWQVTGGGLSEPSCIIDAGNSGTTARLLSGICAGIDGVVAMTGDSSLVKRPMARVIKPLGMMGAKFLARKDRFLPMAIRGGNLKGISYEMDVASAQVKSALLLAGLRAEGITRISEPSLSRDHSERMLRYFGVRLQGEGTAVGIEGGQTLQAREVIVPADPSSAAFPAVWAACLPGSEILLRDVCLNKTRTGVFSVLKRMGADISFENTRELCGEQVGDILVKGGTLQATDIGGSEIPSLIDEIPILVIAACLAQGTTTIRDASELRVKETDRIMAMVQGLSSLGVSIDETPDGLIIKGPHQIRSGAIKTFADHRIAMSFDILSRITGTDVAIDDRDCVDISFPGFFSLMDTLA